MTLLIQRLVDGVQSGVLYGSIALALVLVYRATGLLNFATGEIAIENLGGDERLFLTRVW